MSHDHLATWELTDAQRQGVTQTGKQLIVTAGAGTGKTRVLTSRFAHLVLSGRAPVDRILAITFTEKAAAEMAQRVRSLLHQAGRFDLRRDLAEASISTIHAFCSRLLRENAILAGVDPSFEMLTDFEADRLLDQALDEAMQELKTANPDGYEKLSGTVRTEGRTGADVAAAVRRIYEKLRVERTAIETAFDIENPTDDYNALCGQLGQKIAAYRNAAAGKKSSSVLVANAAMIDRLQAALDVPELESVARCCTETRISRTVANDLKPLVQDLQDTVVQLAGAAAETYAMDSRALLAELATRFDAAYTRVKRARSVLDFADLEQRTLDLFQRRPQVAQSIRERYRFVLVDEFQDVNRLQADLIDRIARPKNLFAVGDPQQSIYGFRHADVEVFRGQMEKPNVTRIRLDRNFRTRQPILDFVNAFFEHHGTVADPNTPYAPLRVGGDDQKQDDGGFAVEFLAAFDDQSGQGRRAEARALALRIQSLLSGVEGPTWTPGDITVLFRSRTQVAQYLAEFIRYRIPFQEVKGRGLFSRSEVVDLQHYLETLADPYDELALAAVLRSPFAGVGDATLFCLCTESPDRSEGLFGAVRRAGQNDRIDPADRQRLDRFVRIYDALDADRSLLPLDRLVHGIFYRTGYLEWALRQPDGARKAGNIERMIHWALGLARPHGPTPRGLAAAMATCRTRAIQEADAPVGQGSNAITVMTVHAAKGLEAPVVILADCNHKPYAPVPPIAFHPDVGVGYSVYLPDFTAVETTTRMHLKERLGEMAVQEDRRLLYVAMTRARQKLILSAGFAPHGKSAPRAEGWAKSLVEILGLPIAEPETWPEKVQLGQRAHVGVLTPDRLAEDPPRQSEEAVVDEAGLLEHYDALPETLPPHDGSRYLYGISEVTAFASCARLFELQYRLGIPVALLGANDLDPTPGETIEPADLERKQALDFGNAVHAILARVPWRSESWQASAKTVAQRHLRDDQQAARAVGSAKAFLDHHDFHAIDQARTVHRELPFLWRHEGRLFRGQIDLLVRDDRGLWLIDYKTDAPEASIASVVGRHRMQMTLYALAAKALFGRRPDRISLFLTETARFAEVVVDDRAEKQAKSAIDTLFEADATGHFPARTERCPDCAHRAWCRPDAKEPQDDPPDQLEFDIDPDSRP